ncbi:hypothetical protein ACFQX6_00605 [Streptosporangium lutulentum]
MKCTYACRVGVRVSQRNESRIPGWTSSSFPGVSGSRTSSHSQVALPRRSQTNWYDLASRGPKAEPGG